MQIINPTVAQITDFLLDNYALDTQNEILEGLRSSIEDDKSNQHVYEQMNEATMSDVRSMELTLHCGPAVLSDTLIVELFELSPIHRFTHRGHTYYTDGSLAYSPDLHDERLAELFENYEENSRS